MRNFESRDHQENPWLVLSYVVAIAVSILAVGYALRWVLPVLLTGVGVAINVAISKGPVTVFAPWVFEVSQIVVISTAVTATTTLIVKGLDKAKEKPYNWLVGIMAVFQPLALDFVKELTPNYGGYSKLIAKALALAVFTAGLVMWKINKGRTVKVLGFLLIMAPPCWVLTMLLLKNWKGQLTLALAAIPPASWIGFVIMSFASVAAIVLKGKLDPA